MDRSNESTLAFTLIEVMIAATILVIGILGMAAVITYATRQDEVNGEHARALSGARSAIENVKNTNFDDILTTWNQDGPGQPDIANRIPDPDTAGKAIGDFTVYRLNAIAVPNQRTYSHSPYPNGTNINSVGSIFIDGLTSPTLLRIKVVVDWDGAFRGQHLELLTMVTDD